MVVVAVAVAAAAAAVHTNQSINNGELVSAQSINVRIRGFFLKLDEGNGNEDEIFDGTCWDNISIFFFISDTKHIV